MTWIHTSKPMTSPQGCSDGVSPQVSSAELQFHWWRHRERGYLVEILGVHQKGQPLSRDYVKVNRSSQTSSRPRSWDAEHFLRVFEPVGQPFQEKTIWDHLE